MMSVSVMSKVTLYNGVEGVEVPKGVELPAVVGNHEELID